MDNTLKIARENFINKGIMILLLAFCMVLQILVRVIGFNVPLFIAIIISALLFVGFIAMTLRPTFEFNKVPKEERKRLFKAHQLHGKKLFYWFSLLVLIPFLCIYLFHFNAFIALQVGGLITFGVVGTLNLRSALRISIN